MKRNKTTVEETIYLLWVEAWDGANEFYLFRDKEKAIKRGEREMKKNDALEYCVGEYYFED